MAIAAADLKPLKTKADKMLQARDFDLGIGVGDEEATRRAQVPPRPLGQASLYRQPFSSYFFWMVTGRGVSEADSGPAEYYGQSKAELGPAGIVHWIRKLLDADKDEVDFNPYGYLLSVLQEQAKYQGTDAPNLAEITNWLLDQAERADAYASLFNPPRYNVRTLMGTEPRDLNGDVNLVRESTPEETERYLYYQRIINKVDELKSQQSDIYELQRSQRRELTVDEEDRLAQKEKQVEYLALGPANQLDFNRLHARHDRKLNAERFKEGLRYRLLECTEFTDIFRDAGSFQPKPDKETGIVSERIIFNLHELEREFDTNLALCSTPSSRATYAAEQLRLFDDNLPHIISHFNPYLELDRLQVTALVDVLHELRTAYAERQQSRLRSFEKAVHRPDIPKFTLRPAQPASPTAIESAADTGIPVVNAVTASRTRVVEDVLGNATIVEPSAEGTLPRAEEAFKSAFRNGYDWDCFMRLVGPRGEKIYEIVDGKPCNSGTPGKWASIYWALRAKSYLPELSAADATALFKNIVSGISKSTINYNEPRKGTRSSDNKRELLAAVDNSLVKNQET